MAAARQATKLTMMANSRRATNLTMMASSEYDYDNGTTAATTMAKATACQATMTMMVQRDANNENDVE